MNKNNNVSIVEFIKTTRLVADWIGSIANQYEQPARKLNKSLKDNLKQQFDQLTTLPQAERTDYFINLITLALKELTQVEMPLTIKIFIGLIVTLVEHADPLDLNDSGKEFIAQIIKILSQLKFEPVYDKNLLVKNFTLFSSPAANSDQKSTEPVIEQNLAPS